MDADFEAWIGRDVPLALEEVLPEVSPSSSRFISGLSMGGYGAFRVGALHPFAGISAHSAITDLCQMPAFVEEDCSWFSGPLAVSELLLARNATLPPLRFDCGTSDALFSSNVELSALLTSSGLSHTFEEFKGGHDWDYWEKHLPKTLAFFDKLA